MMSSGSYNYITVKGGHGRQPTIPPITPITSKPFNYQPTTLLLRKMIPRCEECLSASKITKYGKRRLRKGLVQRWKCGKCGKVFTTPIEEEENVQ